MRSRTWRAELLAVTKCEVLKNADKQEVLASPVGSETNSQNMLVLACPEPRGLVKEPRGLKNQGDLWSSLLLQKAA
jgi:hypothetical protein